MSFRFARVFITWVTVAVFALSSRSSRADELQDKAAAEALFQLAQNLMTEGKFAEACPKFEASQKLDPGIGTLLFLGDCQEKLGKLASAWATFQEAAAFAKSRGDSEREHVAELRATALRTRLSYVTFEVSPGNKMDGFQLRRRGVPVAQGSFGVRLPTDPGTYEIEASAPGYDTWHTTVTVQPEIETPTIVQVPSLRATQTLSEGLQPPAASPHSTLPSDHPQPSGSGNAQKTWGVVTTIVGVAAAATGGVFAILAVRKNNESIGNCSKQDQNLCKPAGVDERNQAKKLANVATGLVIGGGVLVASGTTIYFTAPRDERGKTAGLTLGIQGSF